MTSTVGSGRHTYEVNEDWAQTPEGWNVPMAAVTVDSQDRIYGFNRGEHGVIVFDTNGNYLYDWGETEFSFPHAIYADAHDNIWIVDRNDQQILKYTPQGELLMTIGEKGFRSDTGADPNDWGSSGYTQVTHGGEPFNMPAGIAVAASGDIYIADGYANARVHRFSAEGALKQSWGEPGSGPGQFMLPHGACVTADGRLLIADRENDRIQVFSQGGRFLAEWPTRLIGPAVVWEDSDGDCYVAEHNGGYFSVLDRDGELLARWGDDKYRSCHGAAGDSDGNIYFVQPTSGEGSTGRRIVKYTRV